MGSSTRFLMLLAACSTPPFLRQCCPSHLRNFTHYLNRRHPNYRKSISPSHGKLHYISARKLHMESSAGSLPSSSSSYTTLHPWPEWNGFVDYLSSAGYFNSGEIAEYYYVRNLPDGAALASFSFARHRLDIFGKLPKSDIELLINGDAPFLFAKKEDSEQRVRNLLRSNVPFNGEIAVDLMKYLLSYVSYAIVHSESPNNAQLGEFGVRNLLRAMCQNEDLRTSYRQKDETAQNFTHQSAVYDAVSDNSPERSRPMTRPVNYNIHMKRGDWICLSCSFMNFARNMQCLECDAARPRRVLTGAEWECPQCDFYNYGRNAVCLRCDCKRPHDAGFPKMRGDGGLRSGNAPLKIDEEKIKFWLRDAPHNGRKPAEIGAEDMIDSGYETPKKSGDIMPENNGSKGTHSAEEQQPAEGGSLDGELSIDSILKSNRERDEQSDRMPSEKFSDLPNVADESRESPDFMPIRKGESRFVFSKKKDRSLSSPLYKRRASMENVNSVDHVPFVPFPPNYFAGKANKSQPDTSDPGGRFERTENAAIPESKSDDDYNKASRDSPTASGGGNLENNIVKETDVVDMSEEAKAERWFRRAAQIKDISELGEIPDEDFPSIMPMRKGENRFVLSKRKSPIERRLASSQRSPNLPPVSLDLPRNE